MNGLNLARVRAHAGAGDDVAEEGELGLAELALAELDAEVVLSQGGEHLLQMPKVRLWVGRVDADVVQKHHDTAVQEGCQHLMHEPHKRRRCIREAEGVDRKLVQADRNEFETQSAECASP